MKNFFILSYGHHRTTKEFKQEWALLFWGKVVGSSRQSNEIQQHQEATHKTSARDAPARHAHSRHRNIRAELREKIISFPKNVISFFQIKTSP